MKLEKKSGITYGQPHRQPLGVWESAEVEAQQLGYEEMTIRGHNNPLVWCATASTKHFYVCELT